MVGPIGRRDISPEFFSKFEAPKILDEVQVEEAQSSRKGQEEKGNEARYRKRKQAEGQQKQANAFPEISDRDRKAMLQDSDAFDSKHAFGQKEKDNLTGKAGGRKSTDVDDVLFKTTVAGMSGQFGDYKFGKQPRKLKLQEQGVEAAETKEFTVEEVTANAELYYQAISDLISSGEIKRDIRAYEGLQNAIEATKKYPGNPKALRSLGISLFPLSIQRDLQKHLPDTIRAQADFLKKQK